jgi:hypothetical protein
MVPLTIPDLDGPITVLADWLELRALFSEGGEPARVQELCAQEDLEIDEDSEEIDADDARLDDLAAQIGAEVDRRRTALESAYPFSMSDEGDALSLRADKDWTHGEATYLLSLLLAQASKSDIVSGVVAPLPADLIRARDIFQICGTLAAATHCQGPSFSFGFPRPDSSGFLEKVKQIWAIFGDGMPRDVALADSPEDVKDEGIDVVSWRPQPDKKPGTHYLLAQVASGNNWKNKSVVESIKLFHEEWFTVVPATPCEPAVIVPFFVEGAEMRRSTRTHGIVIDRGRLPRLAGKAAALAETGVAPIERLDEVDKVKEWVVAHRDRVLAETEE